MINIRPCNCTSLEQSQKRQKDLFLCIVRHERCATWVMCHDKGKLKGFCWRQAYLVLCLCSQWLIGLWISMICFQGSDSEYPDYANLPPSRGWGKLKKNDKAFLWCGTSVSYFLACDLPYIIKEFSTFSHPYDKSHSIIKLKRWTFPREHTHPNNEGRLITPRYQCQHPEPIFVLLTFHVRNLAISNQQVFRHPKASWMDRTNFN